MENKFNLAISLLSLSEYSKAEKYLENIYEQFPDNKLNILALAECNIMQRKWNKAIKLYKTIIKLFPDSESYIHYLERAEDVVAREKYVRAKELFNTATIELKQKNDKKALNILLEATPKGIELEEVVAEIKKIPGVKNLWTVEQMNKGFILGK